MAFKGSPSSQHQHCTDEAQKAETVLSAIIYITSSNQRLGVRSLPVIIVVCY